MKTVKTIPFIILCTFFYIQPMEKTQSKKSEATKKALRDFNLFLIKQFIHKKKYVELPKEEQPIFESLPHNTQKIVQEIFNEMYNS